MAHLVGAAVGGRRQPSRIPTDGVKPISFIDLKAQYARIGSAVEQRVREVMESGRYVMGPVVAELEERLADLAGVNHAIAVSSGTDALLIPLLAKGIGPGDAVFIPSFTFAATAEVVVLAGAVPVFVDADPATFNIAPDSLKAKIADVEREGRLRPRAVIAVDLFGQPADYGALGPIAQAHDLFLIGDAAQAFGATVHNHPVGSLADVTATSFYPSKPLGCFGDGGAVFTDDDDLAEILASVRNHGQGVGPYDNVRLGVNGRLDAIQAAVLLVKLEIFGDELDARESLAAMYGRALSGSVAIPFIAPGVRSSWAQYTVKSDTREALKVALAEASIPSMVYYPRPMHLQPAYADYGDGSGSLPVSEALCEEVISLPFHPYLEGHEIARVAEAVHAYTEAAAA
jgi:dTDP-4-amino-4,6-dideoxygalactose transaminase